jgi:aspartate-semialdehyde dehydrogenase
MGFRVAVVGATGNVGRQMLEILAERQFPVSDVVALASERSIGSEVSFGESRTLKVKDLAAFDFRGIDIVLSSPGAKVSAVHSPRAATAGAVVIDNTSHFRMEPDVPLVVPEVNRHAIAGYRKRRIIANPNCSTIQMVVALAPLHRQARIRRVVVSTYQSVSGWGRAAQEELRRQTPEALERGEAQFDPTIFARQIAFNVFPHIDKFTDSGYTKEELKMINETRKILSEPDLRIAPTTVRVPVFVGHAESINIETERKLTADDARAILRDAPGVHLMDEPAGETPRGDPLERTYPTPKDVEDERYRDAVLVGRIREDPTVEAGLHLWVVADNLRKGAALNAIQIAEGMLQRGYL